jgi:hypothetical protein
MHPMGQNRGAFALSITIGPIVISITDDDCVLSVLTVETKTRIDERTIDLLIKR